MRIDSDTAPRGSLQPTAPFAGIADTAVSADAEPAPLAVATAPTAPQPAAATALSQQRQVALFAALWLLFNFPLLALWDHPLQVLGLPLLPLALFSVWAVAIGLLAWLMESQPG